MAEWTRKEQASGNRPLQPAHVEEIPQTHPVLASLSGASGAPEDTHSTMDARAFVNETRASALQAHQEWALCPTSPA